MRKGWGKLFENFVFNYYRIENPKYQVKKERIAWLATSLTDPNLTLLPSMETDISLRDENRTIIIDTKFYRETLQSYYDKESIHSKHLYQIFAYLKNIEHRGGNDAMAEGVLLYPTVTRSLMENYKIHDHKVRICTVDLSRDWTSVKEDLDRVVA